MSGQPSTAANRDYETQLINRIAVREAARKLPQRDRIVLASYYHAGLTFNEIATQQGISRNRVHQIHHRALNAIRRNVNRPPFPENFDRTAFCQHMQRLIEQRARKREEEARQREEEARQEELWRAQARERSQKALAEARAAAMARTELEAIQQQRQQRRLLEQRQEQAARQQQADARERVEARERQQQQEQAEQTALALTKTPEFWSRIEEIADQLACASQPNDTLRITPVFFAPAPPGRDQLWPWSVAVLVPGHKDTAFVFGCAATAVAQTMRRMLRSGLAMRGRVAKFVDDRPG